MHSLKDKVSNQLSRFFPHNSSPPDPNVDNDGSQARPVSNGGKSFTSYFPFGVPSLNFGGSKSKKQQPDLKPLQSLPVRWGSKSYKHQDEHRVKHHECNMISENDSLLNSSRVSEEISTISVKKQTEAINMDDEAERSSSDSDMFEEACDQQTPLNSLPDLMQESSFISSELYECLGASLPNIVKGCQWALLYSTLKHGISLRTLIRKSAELYGPCLLIAGDRQGAVFGGLLECPLQPTPKRKYQGTNQTFVFTTKYGEPRLFRPTGANRYYYMCINDLLALGGGGSYALSLDGDLLNGTSGPCDTFGNLCLAHTPEFELKNVELWGFTHSSRYLN